VFSYFPLELREVPFGCRWSVDWKSPSQEELDGDRAIGVSHLMWFILVRYEVFFDNSYGEFEKEGYRWCVVLRRSSVVDCRA